MCTPQRPANSPIAKLMLAEERIFRLTPDLATDTIEQEFAQFRELLWQLIEVAPDPAIYTLAWNTVNLHAKVDLLDFVQGNIGALRNLQDKVRQAMELLPWKPPFGYRSLIRRYLQSRNRLGDKKRKFRISIFDSPYSLRPLDAGCFA